MKGTNIRAALVSTNSISQGEQVALLWKPLCEKHGIHIDFAHRTFKWDSDSQGKAHVHCVVVGFSTAENKEKKIIFDGESKVEAKNINGYLVDADDIFIENKSEPICKDAPRARSGNQPIDGGNYLFTEEEMKDFIAKEPKSKKCFRPWYGSEEFINQKPRYCLWLGDCPSNELFDMPECRKRVEAVKQFRLKSKRDGTVKLAETPRHFQVETILNKPFLVLPLTSSERRRYVPIGFMSPECLPSNLVVTIADATLYHFGVLTSDVFMSWMRAVCGRLEMRYRITKDNVYNNFPWPEPNKEQKATIEKTAQAILDERKKLPNRSLADLYGEAMDSVWEDSRDAHKANDAAVRKAYGFKTNATESEIVAKLFKLYQEISDLPF